VLLKISFYAIAMQHFEHFLIFSIGTPSCPRSTYVPGKSRVNVVSQLAEVSGVSPTYAAKQLPGHSASPLPNTASLPVNNANNSISTTSPNAARMIVLNGSPCAFLMIVTFLSSLFSELLLYKTYYRMPVL